MYYDVTSKNGQMPTGKLKLSCLCHVFEFEVHLCEFCCRFRFFIHIINDMCNVIFLIDKEYRMTERQQ